MYELIIKDKETGEEAAHHETRIVCATCLCEDGNVAQHGLATCRGSEMFRVALHTLSLIRSMCLLDKNDEMWREILLKANELTLLDKWRDDDDGNAEE